MPPSRVTSHVVSVTVRPQVLENLPVVLHGLAWLLQRGAHQSQVLAPAVPLRRFWGGWLRAVFSRGGFGVERDGASG